MKKILFQAFALTISLSAIIVSCSKPSGSGGNMPSPQQTEKIVVPDDVNLNPVVTSESKITTIPFATTEPWTASVTSTKSNSWIDINPKNGGAGNAYITIIASANESNESRTATIVIICGGEKITIVFTQAGKGGETSGNSSIDDVSFENW